MPTLTERVEILYRVRRECHPGHVMFFKRYHLDLESGERREREKGRKLRLGFLEARVACLLFEERPKSKG